MAFIIIAELKYHQLGMQHSSQFQRSPIEGWGTAARHLGDRNAVKPTNWCETQMH